ncbi:diaminopropionate ammonia-lyase family protein [Lentithecium fluviatile CBS 122367]|uniref:Diaminopropionate ammonia-lyase family protein n=1 Tax=Lentithecium fluviatile CBS 122367 TaxID=1168545 RepID=A0A6G1JBA4_9PLEO|nr:diaminopropionate ammonia-lyase family protein [Lentithecium fluviatile CBS 122367]
MFLNPSANTWRYQTPPKSTSSESQVLAFHQGLPDYNQTPLVPLPDLAKELGIGHALLKDESNRFGLPAFKILGASWATQKLLAQKCNLPPTSSLQDLGRAASSQNLTLVTCTEGNWGRAIARMSNYLSLSCTIFVPSFMPPTTLLPIALEGANVIITEGSYDDTVRAVRKEAEKEGRLLVMDIGWEGYEEVPQWVVEGYGTMLAETDARIEGLKLPPVTHAIASVGVGSWAQAAVQHYKSASNPHHASVITVEPDTAASLKASLEAGKITSIATGHTIMDGMNCGTVSYTAWPVLKEGVDASVEVSDVEAHRDLIYLHERGVRNGPCGAAPLSALRRLAKEGKLGLGKDSVVVLFSTEGSRAYVAPE